MGLQARHGGRLLSLWLHYSCSWLSSGQASLKTQGHPQKSILTRDTATSPRNWPQGLPPGNQAHCLKSAFLQQVPSPLQTPGWPGAPEEHTFLISMSTLPKLGGSCSSFQASSSHHLPPHWTPPRQFPGCHLWAPTPTLSQGTFLMLESAQG